MPAPTHVTVSPRSFACDLATICAPTLGRPQARQSLPLPAGLPARMVRAMAVAWHALLAPRGVTVRVLKPAP